MGDWRKPFRSNPLPPLLSSRNEALRYFTRRDLLDQGAESVESLWELSEVKRLVDQQLRNGALA